MFAGGGGLLGRAAALEELLRVHHRVELVDVGAVVVRRALVPDPLHRRLRRARFEAELLPVLDDQLPLRRLRRRRKHVVVVTVVVRLLLRRLLLLLRG